MSVRLERSVRLEIRPEHTHTSVRTIRIERRIFATGHTHTSVRTIRIERFKIRHSTPQDTRIRMHTTECTVRLERMVRMVRRIFGTDWNEWQCVYVIQGE